MSIIRRMAEYCIVDSDGIIVAYFNSLTDAITFISDHSQ